MAISNTSILIKRSSATAKPTSLAAGELAYSYLSNTLFIGTPTGTATLNIGGQFYTSTIDSATASNVVSTLVRRDANGAFFGRLYGLSNTALAWQTARNISVSGDATGSVSIDGSADAAIPVTLSTTGVSAGTYGGGLAIPVLTIAANGRVISASNAAFSSGSTSFGVQGNSGTTTFFGGNTLIVVGSSGSGISTAITTNTITVSTDNTFVRSNTSVGPQQINSALNISGNVAITGNLIVTGNVVTQGVSELIVNDPMIYLAGNNYTSDVVDIGFAANYFDGTWERHTGLFRDATVKQYYLFDNYLPELSGNNEIDTANTSFRLATLRANVIATQANASILNASVANLTSLTLGTALGIGSGGTNTTTYAQNGVLFYNGSQFLTLANTTAYTSQGSSTYVPVITTDTLGRVTSITNTAIDMSQVTTGTLPIARGGTNNTTYTIGQRIVNDGTKLASQANTSTSINGVTTGTLTSATSNTITAGSINSYGEVTSLTTAPIAIAASQVTSGQLAIAQGGTNNSSFTPGSLTFFDGTKLASFANSSFTATGSGAANNTVTSLTVDSYGRLTAATFAAISGLTVGQGGTGRSTFTANGIVYGNGTGALQVTAAADTSDQTWSNQILTVTNAGIPVWSTAMDGGSF